MFAQMIKENYSSLSPGQKKVAEFIVNQMDEGALLTAFQIGRKVGVSETTVIRLAYALGFSGYSHMQEAIRKDWLSSKQAVESEGNPSSTEETNEEQLFHYVIHKERAILQQLLQQLNTNEVWKAVDAFIQADRVYIGGFGSSYAAAYWFYYTLKQLRENVFISQPTGFSLEDICELNEKSVVVLFSFPRYRKESMALAELAKKQQAMIISMTNRQLSPVGQLADVTLTTEEQMNSDYHSIASVVSLLEVLIAGIHHRDRERISQRQQKLEFLYTGQGLFLE
ncbi:MurR/RpiR family transcriptional regulator [Metabacillus iocasae]|uniref:DNA-binding MurR/RpiR family transcriptional regulator n=1 Tax=Priestia iocasae TaxID=2291674 RepID=A0ABS2QY53_9BACI|nr:MurR/RpiR family transcriptional regulator [Metabacillus iocasae]MBM7704400.1 DNA-binding MurR/RpiR family transcriptional regulator [Metabacillus iocasae]